MTLCLPAVGEVHLWRVELDRETAQPELLSKDEQARAERFRFEQDARRWAIGRSLLRRTLAAYFNTPPAHLRLETGPWGKPCLVNCPLRFNISHSGGTALLAFAWQQEVGVDIEWGRSDFSPEELASQVFSAEEQSELRDIPIEKRHAAFLSLWTAKEAFVKALGAGLSYPMAQLSFKLIAGTNMFQVEDKTPEQAGATFSAIRLELGTEYFAALALEGPLLSVRYCDPLFGSSETAV